jgi:lysozyme
MKTSDNGIRFIARWEGFSPTAYMDKNDGWTIGYGTLIDTEQEFYLINSTISKEKALELKKRDIGRFEAAVRGQVTAPINQNQFDALVSLVYNIGPGNFQDSTVLKRINRIDTKKRIKEAWEWWNKDDGKVVQGLINRREAETALYFSEVKKKVLIISSILLATTIVILLIKRK